jgi:type II secretory pathway component PulF
MRTGLFYNLADADNEIFQQVRCSSNIALLIRTLAWAAQHDIPFVQALLTLREQGAEPVRRGWNKALATLIRHQQKGRALAPSLRASMSNFLPEYLLQAVDRSERDGTLAQTLPQLAERLDAMAQNKNSFSQALYLPVLEMICIALLVVGLGILILPRLISVFEELFEGAAPNTSWTILQFITNNSPGYLFLLILFLLLIKLTPARLGRYIASAWEEIMYYIPFLRKQAREAAMLELCSAMGSYLACGETMECAAKFAMNSSRQWWMRRKLQCFINQINHGENWLDAWNKMGFNQPLCELMLHNAALRDEVPTGFDAAALWFQQQSSKNILLNIFMMRYFMLAVNVALVLAVCVSIFSILTRIITALAR